MRIFTRSAVVALLGAASGCSQVTEPAGIMRRVSVRVDSLPVSPLLIGAVGPLNAVRVADARAVNDTTVELQGIVAGSCIPRPRIAAFASEHGDTLRVVVTPSFSLDVSQIRCALPKYYAYYVSVSPTTRGLAWARLQQKEVRTVSAASDTIIRVRTN